MSSFARVDTRRTPSTRHADGRASDEDDDESEDEEQPSQHQHQHYQEPEEDWSRPHFQPSHHPPAHRSSASSSPHRPPSRLYQKSYTARNLRPREVTPRRSQPSKDEAAYGRDGAPEELGWIGRSIGAGSSTLWLFTACQILIFYDRGMVAGFLPSVQRDIGGLSDTEAGVLGSGFIFGYMLACPLFAFFSKSISPYKLMALGLFLWSAATLACGLSEKFIPLLTARILTGVGEASFAGLAPTCIDDVAPMKHRTIWLSFFFAGIPLGSAAGYVSGGYFAKAGWHVGFLLEAAVMLPLVVIVFFWPNHEQSVKATAEVASREKSQIRRTNSWARMPRPDDGQIRGPGYTQYGSTTEDQTRLLPSPPVPTQGQQPQQQAHLLPAMLGDHSGHFVRSVSTPSLKRLDSTPHGADEQKQQRERPIPESPSSAAASIEQQQPQLPASQAGDDADEKHSAPPTPSGRSGRTSRARTPRAMDRAYITPDPSNPFHVAPAVSANAAPTTAPIATDAASLPHSALRVRTPGYQEQVAYRHQMDLAHLHTDAPVTPTAHLPSPSSFNPHYAARAALSHSAARSTTDAQGRLIHPSDADGLPSVDEDMFVTDIITLLTDGVYIVVVLGYAALAFVIGALSFWGPVDFAIHLHIGLGRSTRMIGAITFVCGLGGTFFGGWVMDKRGGGKGIFAVISALELCCLFTTLAIGFAMAAVSCTDLTISMTCLALADFFLFATGAPVNASLLSVAPKNMRSLAMAMSILLMHALGDLPSPFLMGVITDQVGSITLALMCLCAWLLWTVFFWAIGVYLAKARAEAFKVQLEHDMSLPIAERSALLARRGSTGSFLASRPEFLDSMQQRKSLQRPYQYFDTNEFVTQPYPHSAFEPPSPLLHGGGGGRAHPHAQHQHGRGGRKARIQAQTPPARQRTIYQPRVAPMAVAEGLPIYTQQSTLPIYDQTGRIVGFFAGVHPELQAGPQQPQQVGVPHSLPASSVGPPPHPQHPSVSWAPLPPPSPMASAPPTTTDGLHASTQPSTGYEKELPDQQA